MGRLKQGYIDLIADVISLKKDNKQKFKTVNVFDNQVDEMIKANGYSFHPPACLIQILLPDESEALGMGVQSYPNTQIRFHIISQLLNDGKFMERNLDVFDLREDIITKFNLYGSLTGFSTFMKSEDKQDFKHGNIYKYIVGFTCNFIDIVGTIYDNPNTGTISTMEVIINEDLTVNIPCGS